MSIKHYVWKNRKSLVAEGWAPKGPASRITASSWRVAAKTPDAANPNSAEAHRGLDWLACAGGARKGRVPPEAYSR